MVLHKALSDLHIFSNGIAGLKYIDLIHCHDIESAKDMKQARARNIKPEPVSRGFSNI